MYELIPSSILGVKKRGVIMWLMNYMAKKSINTPNAVKGSVKGNDLSGTSVASSGEHKMLKSCLPFGVVSVPPKGEQAVVLALDGSEVGLGLGT